MRRTRLVIGLAMAASVAVGAQTTWSEQVGTLESPAARVTVTAGAFADIPAVSQRLRGIRMNFAHLVPSPDCMLRMSGWADGCSHPNRPLFVREDQLQNFHQGLVASTRSGMASVTIDDEKCGPIAEYRAGRLGEMETGLIVCGYTLQGRSASELGALVAKAIDLLKAR